MNVARAEWTLWSAAASVVVTAPDALRAAVEITQDVVRSIDEACSRFRPDSELALLCERLPEGVEVSATLAMLVDRALQAARWTDGDVDPTLGNELIDLGYDRDIQLVQQADASAAAEDAFAITCRESPGWQGITLDGRRLRVPAGLTLDLGASAKAVAADLSAARVADRLGCGVLVCLGGDIATAGAAPANGWEVLVQDLPADPAQQIALASGFSLATSSTQKRRWSRAGRQVHHILDPRFGLPADPVWRSVSVAAHSCLRANALSTASIVRGLGAVEWLGSLGADARLVDRAGRTVTTGRWPSAVHAPVTSKASHG